MFLCYINLFKELEELEFMRQDAWVSGILGSWFSNFKFPPPFLRDFHSRGLFSLSLIPDKILRDV